MNFRKHSCLFLAFFLLVSNLGLAFNVHYCDDEIASVSISSVSNSQEIEKDCCGKVEKESKCCKNKIIRSNEKSDQIAVKIFSVDSHYNLVYNEWNPLVYTNTIHFVKRDVPAYYCDANAPPLYLLYSQFTFYA